MILKAIGTGSKGNCYLFKPQKGKSLIIDCGVNFKEVKKVKDYFKKRGLQFSDNPSELIERLNYYDEIILSNKKHAKLIDRKSASTASRHKKKLMEQDKQIKFVPRVSNRTYCSITEHYAAISNGSIPAYSKYKNGYSYYDLPTEILICSSSSYYNNSLYYYRNKKRTANSQTNLK